MQKINKLVKNIFCGIIPSFGLRHAIRDNLLDIYWKHKKEYKKNFKKFENSDFKYFLSIVLIIKDEASYIEEWIEYHKLVGVEHFYIYDNESSDNLKKILQPYIKSGLVDYIYWPGQRQQKNAYFDALTKHRMDTKWLGFIDSDEFIVPISKKTIPEIIEDLKIKNGLAIHWCHYGDNGHKTRTQGLVIERFTKRALDSLSSNKICKPIINPRVAYYMTPHNAYFLGNKTSVDENGKTTGMAGNVSINKIRVNHYFGKSEEEFINKIKRGDVIRKTNGYNLSGFYALNHNDVEDKIMEKYVPQIKEALKCKK